MLPCTALLASLTLPKGTFWEQKKRKEITGVVNETDKDATVYADPFKRRRKVVL
jgi:hypothetical protein